MENKPSILDSEYALLVLKEIEANPKVSQRHLAQRLEVSLGKTNFLLNALIDKGIIEVKNFKNQKNKLAYMYLLTPAGLKTKILLTHKFFLWKIREYEKLRKEIEDFRKDIQLGNAVVNTEDNLV